MRENARSCRRQRVCRIAMELGCRVRDFSAEKSWASFHKPLPRKPAHSRAAAEAGVRVLFYERLALAHLLGLLCR
jgi:hypothetical protein